MKTNHMKTPLFVLLATLLCCGCEKDYDDSKPINPKYNTPIETKLEGLTDIVMQQVAVYEIPVTLSYIAGAKEKVGIAFTNMPKNVFVTITPQIDTPTYNSKLKFVADNADTGTSTVTVTTTATKEVSARTYSFNITIKPSPINYALGLVGNYTENGACDKVGAVNHQAMVSAVPGYLNRIKIQNIWTGASSYYLIANINPSDHSVVIDPQPVNGITFTGGGTYTSSSIELHYQFTDGNLLNDNCSTTLSR